MFENIELALDFIFNRHNIKASMSQFNKLLEKHNDFHKKLKVVHVSGTNGKGSTSKLLSDILINSNYSVGLFTSPHMVVVNDRIRINNKYISDDDLLRYVNYFYDDINEYKLNFFQIYTLIAFKYFFDRKCDICIIEVGIGGLLDSTNVVDGIISIITNINYDHTQILGNTLEDIAIQKSGIIKENNHTITRVENKEALDVIINKAKSVNSTLHILDSVLSKRINDKLFFTFNNNEYYLNSFAKYQVDNALISITAANILNDYYNFNISDSAIKKSLNEFVWFGRYEVISNDPKIILDGAHNVAAIKALIKNKDDNTVVIFSALHDKEYTQMLELLIENYFEVVFCEFDFHRALKITDLADFDIVKFSNFKEALDYYKNKYNKDILVCGSLYFISDVRGYF